MELQDCRMLPLSSMLESACVINSMHLRTGGNSVRHSSIWKQQQYPCQTQPDPKSANLAKMHLPLYTSTSKWLVLRLRAPLSRSRRGRR